LLLLCFLLRGLCCCFGSFLPGSFIWIIGNFGAKVTDELQYCHEYRFWPIEKIILPPSHIKGRSSTVINCLGSLIRSNNFKTRTEEVGN
jgi:hypothetical protein